MLSETELNVTDKAQSAFAAALETEDLQGYAIRVVARRRSAIKLHYELDFCAPEDVTPNDRDVWAGDLRFVLDEQSCELLKGVSLDYIDEGENTGFQFSNPNEQVSWSDPIAQKLQDFFESDINPGLAAHGGHVDLIDYRDGIAYVTMGGGCQGCGMAKQTMSQGVETRVREAIPEVKQLIDSTDHAAGANPYYAQE